MNILYKDHVNNEDVFRKIQVAICLSKDDYTGHSKKEREEKVERRCWRTILKSGQGWTCQLKTGLGERDYCSVCQRVFLPLSPRKNANRKDNYIVKCPDLKEPLFPHSHFPPPEFGLSENLYGLWYFAEGI